MGNGYARCLKPPNLGNINGHLWQKSCYKVLHSGIVDVWENPQCASAIIYRLAGINSHIDFPK